MPILEAMACGTPVVTSNNSSLGEIASDAAIYLSEPVFESLIDAMERLENDMIEVDSLIKKGLNRASEFTWAKTASETVQVYSNFLI